MMTASASFHRNVYLLTQLIEPTGDFKKHFREGMFDKPNTGGFLHMSHYLLTIYDSDQFKKLIEWPVICKKSETKYRNSVKDYLTIVSQENPDIGFPSILMSHLIHASGSKFTIIMWKLSEVVVRKYFTQQITPSVMFAPQIGSLRNLTQKLLQETNAKLNCSISNQYKSILEIENTTKIILEKQKETSDKVIAEIFEKEQLIENLSNAAPVHSSVKRCLQNINDRDVIKMWKENINKQLNCLQRKNTVLKEIEQLTSKIKNIILSHSDDGNILDLKKMEKINCSDISHLFRPDIQCLLYQLYRDDKLVFNNFVVLFNYVMTQLHQRLKLSTLEDISDLSLEMKASCTDLKNALSVIQTYVEDVTKMTAETQDILRQRSAIKIHDDALMPIMNNMLITLSPRINIDTDHSDEKVDLQTRLQLTPMEAAHKSLFSRYERLKQYRTPRVSKFRENLLASRINFDDTIASASSDKRASSVHTSYENCSMSAKKNILSFKQTDKYSRLFSNRMKRYGSKANLSLISLPCFSKANSTTIANAIEEMNDKEAEDSPDCLAKSTEVATSNLDARSDCEEKSEMEDVVNEFLDKPVSIINENNDDNNVVQTVQTKQRRRSIGDLVERYRKLLEKHHTAPRID